MADTVTAPSWRHTRARLANHARNYPGQTPPDELVTEHATARLADHIARVVAAAPPLSADQRARLAVLLRPAPAEKSGAA